MKKFLLTVSCLLTLFAGQKASAQSFTTEKDTVTALYSGTAQINVLNEITNTTASNIQITWHMISTNFPSDWSTSAALGICDQQNCYTGTQILDQSSHTAPYAPGAGDFHMTLDASGPSTGTYYLTVNLRSSAGDSKNITFLVSKWPTGVNNVIKNTTDVDLYPNPARNNINVVFDGNAGVKTIAVYNLIGKPVSTFRVSGASAQLDISDIPSGVYFIRLMDAQNRVLATRKFTRQ